MSTSSREYSPDWLRNAQAPTTSILMLSSSSESLAGGSPVSEDDKDDQLPISSVTKKASQVKSPSKGNRANKKVAKGKTPTKPQEPKVPVWTLPSDSEYELSDDGTGQHPKEEEEEEEEEPGASKLKSPSPKKRLKMEGTETIGKNLTKQENDGVSESKATEKQTGSYVSSSRLPLVLADKVQRSKALVECEGESIDLSGDLGSVGRVVVSDSPSGNQDVLLDLKGTIYKMTILPSRTFCVVSFGQSEAKIEAIMDDFVQLKPQSNVYEAETMVEGTLEGFSFDSEDEADKNPKRQTAADENKQGGGDADTQTNTNGKAKASGAKRKGKVATKKPAKKVTKKAPAAKKSKTKK